VPWKEIAVRDSGESAPQERLRQSDDSAIVPSAGEKKLAGVAESSGRLEREVLPVTLLPMTPADVKKVHEIEKDSYPCPWPRRAFFKMLRSRWLKFFTAFADGKVVGYAGMRLGDSAHIVNIAVHRHYRRCGIGSRLLSVLVEMAVRHGANRVTLEVRASNLSAQAMYRKSGFAAVAVKEGYYTREKEDAIFMAKELVEQDEHDLD
jgi:ribosomal-protein-alanine N-acetyltransferase